VASSLEIRGSIHCEFIAVCSHRRVVNRTEMREPTLPQPGPYLYSHEILTSVLGVWGILSHQAQGRELEGLMEGLQEDDG
jgi:hypothetical protein